MHRPIDQPHFASLPEGLLPTALTPQAALLPGACCGTLHGIANRLSEIAFANLFTDTSSATPAKKAGQQLLRWSDTGAVAVAAAFQSGCESLLNFTLGRRCALKDSSLPAYVQKYGLLGLVLISVVLDPLHALLRLIVLLASVALRLGLFLTFLVVLTLVGFLFQCDCNQDLPARAALALDHALSHHAQAAIERLNTLCSGTRSLGKADRPANPPHTVGGPLSAETATKEKVLQDLSRNYFGNFMSRPGVQKAFIRLNGEEPPSAEAFLEAFDKLPLPPNSYRLFSTNVTADSMNLLREFSDPNKGFLINWQPYIEAHHTPSVYLCEVSYKEASRTAEVFVQVPFTLMWRPSTPALQALPLNHDFTPLVTGTLTVTFQCKDGSWGDEIMGISDLKTYLPARSITR